VLSSFRVEHFSGKPGNIREFCICSREGNVRELAFCQELSGECQRKILSGLFFNRNIFTSISLASKNKLLGPTSFECVYNKHLQ